MSEVDSIGSECALMAMVSARAMDEFCVETVGDELVLFEPDRFRYHTLNRHSLEIWRSLDGSRTVEEVAERIYGDRSDAHVSVVQLGIDALAESGLLIEPEPETPAVLDRRWATKLAVAALAGVVGLPVVQSITAPDAASADTCLPDPNWINGHPCVSGDSCRCWFGCCCPVLTTQSWCTDRSACEGSGRACI